MRVLDARGHSLDSKSVRYEWMSGDPLSVSPTGVTKCTRAGDANIRASVGNIASRVLVQCRPVQSVRFSMMVNLVVGDPPEDVAFEAKGPDGKPVSLLRGQITIDDSSIVAVDGMRIRGRVPGVTDVTLRIGDREAGMTVHVYEPAQTPERIQPGQHLAVPVLVADGEMRQWRLPAAPELYYVAMLSKPDNEQMPGLAVAGANCERGLAASSFFCLARHDASVIAYYPQHVASAKMLDGTLLVWRQPTF